MLVRVLGPRDGYGAANLGGVQLWDEETSSNLLITAVFWDVFNANSAVTDLLRAGFADADIEAVGVLLGAAPDVTGLLSNIGVPRVDARNYNDYFQDGAVLVAIRTNDWRQYRAIQVLRRHGALMPARYHSQIATIQELRHGEVA